jgi:hypothetical protein
MRLMISATVALAAITVFGSVSTAGPACASRCEQYKGSGERACHALDDYEACMRQVTEAAATCFRNCK